MIEKVDSAIPARASHGCTATWQGCVHGIAFLLIIRWGVPARLMMVQVLRGDRGWPTHRGRFFGGRCPLGCFRVSPWGNKALFLSAAVVTGFPGIALAQDA
jgi:hypothetical protein